jgi:hypothetical protein
MHLSHTHVQNRVLANALDTLPHQPHGPFEGFLIPEEHFVSCASIALVRQCVGKRPLDEFLALVGTELQLKRLRNRASHFFLDIEDVVECAGVALGPEMRVRSCIDQLRGDAQVIPRLARAPL